MQLEVGKIYDGKVTEIAKFGAFVEIEGKTGMVHISEISNTYVTEVKDHVKVGQEVKVKVLGISEGKVSLSMKKALPREDKPVRSQGGQFRGQNRDGDNRRRFQDKQGDFRKSRPAEQRDPSQPPPMFDSDEQPRDNSFEDMLSKFKQTSEEKFSDLKRITDNKRRTGARRK